MDNIIQVFLCFALGAVIVVMFHVFVEPIPIVSKTPIQPELKIEIVDGVADTTYIYKEK